MVCEPQRDQAPERVGVRVQAGSTLSYMTPLRTWRKCLERDENTGKRE